MRKVVTRLILLPLSLLVCTGGFAQKKRSNTPHAPGEDIYKHYTGTIGKKKVVLDLRYGYQGSSNYGGSKYYSPGQDDRVLFYISEPATFDHDVTLTAEEEVGVSDQFVTDGNKLLLNDGKPGGKWEFTIKGNKLTGTWKSADGNTQNTIELKEDYSQSVALELRYIRNISQEIMPGRNKPLATANLLYVIPSETVDEATKTLVGRAMNELLRLEKNDSLEGVATSDQYNYQFFATCGNIVDGMSENEIPQNPFSQFTQVMPVYNDNGLLVLDKKDETSLGTEKKVSRRISYIDVRSRKIWSPVEILNVAAPELSSVVEAAARKQFGWAQDKELSSFISTNKMPVSEYFYPANKGVFFCYRPTELFKSEDDNSVSMYGKDIEIYVPYDKLGDALQPAFLKRVGG